MRAAAHLTACADASYLAPMLDTAVFAERARRVGLNEAELCRRANVSPSTLWRWRKGKYEPKMRTVRQLDEVLTAEETRLATEA